MPTNPPRRRGRPKSPGAPKHRVGIYLTARDEQVMLTAGNGNLTAGAAIVIEHWRQRGKRGLSMAEAKELIRSIADLRRRDWIKKHYQQVIDSFCVHNE